MFLDAFKRQFNFSKLSRRNFKIYDQMIFFIVIVLLNITKNQSNFNLYQESIDLIFKQNSQLKEFKFY